PAAAGDPDAAGSRPWHPGLVAVRPAAPGDRRPHDAVRGVLRRPGARSGAHLRGRPAGPPPRPAADRPGLPGAAAGGRRERAGPDPDRWVLGAHRPLEEPGPPRRPGRPARPGSPGPSQRTCLTGTLIWPVPLHVTEGGLL